MSKAYYQSGNLECIAVIRAIYGLEAVKSFCLANSFKYLLRAGKKPNNTAREDIEKAVDYLTRWIAYCDEEMEIMND